MKPHKGAFCEVIVKTNFALSKPLCTDLSHITTELWEIPVLRMAH